MKQKLSVREIVLLCILLALALVSAWYLWFYVPAIEERTNLEMEIYSVQDLIEIDQVRMVRMQRMNNELEDLFAEDPDITSMALYDNSQNVMEQLNALLSSTVSYSLDFAPVENGAEDNVLRREVKMQFRTASYAEAKSILQQLHDSGYRCILDDLTINADTDGQDDWWIQKDEQEQEDAVDVNVTVVFFEYRQ